MIMATPFGLAPTPTGNQEVEMRDVHNSIRNINKNLERQVPSQIDPVVHYQYTQIMQSQEQFLQEQLHH